MTEQVKQQREIKLKVMEALQEEAYRGIIRVDAQTMREIGVRVGDVVEVEGSRVTVASVDRAYPADIGQGIIRMDGIIRRNAKTGIGEIVKVRRADVKEAKSIIIAPAQQGVMVQADPEIFRSGLLGRSLVKGDQIALGGSNRRRPNLIGNPFEDIFDVIEQGFMGGYGFGGLKFIIVNTNPKQAVIITEQTEVLVNPKATEVVDEKIIDVTYEDIGGLSEEVKKVREMIELPLKHPEIFSKLGIEPPKGVLLYGVPGTGKTLLAKAVANETNAHFISINGPEVVSKFVGEAERRIRKIFEEAEKNAPTIIFIDEIDAIAPKREETYGEVERRIVAQLLATMDGLKSRGRVIVIGATNRPNSIDPALRRPGRFDREIEIGVPDKKGRLSILKIHTRNMPLTKDVSINRLAEISHGFVGADLEALCKEAAMNVLRRILPDLKFKEDKPIDESFLEKLKVTDLDFKYALKIVRPSAMREVFVETPNVKWEEIGGLEDIKQDLKESVEWPLKHPNSFKRLGIRATKGILIYGPPGTGKTLLGKAVATESESNFILVKGPELLNMFVGESEKGVRKVFERARQVAPAIIFFDEIDSITSRRSGGATDSGVTERVVAQLLTEMDGLEELTDVVVIGATNRPDLVDPALLRPGRFDRIISTSIPDKKTRQEILKIHTAKIPLAKDVNINKLLETTDKFVGADLEALCREAALLALRENIKIEQVSMKHFEAALKRVKPSVTEQDLKNYKNIEEEYMKKIRGAALRKDTNYFG